jgi:hypothetical protein
MEVLKRKDGGEQLPHVSLRLSLVFISYFAVDDERPDDRAARGHDPGGQYAISPDRPNAAKTDRLI